MQPVVHHWRMRLVWSEELHRTLIDLKEQITEEVLRNAVQNKM